MGQVNLQGSIISNACNIATDDKNQVVDMADETRRDIKRNGQGRINNFSIHLVDCVLNSGPDKPWSKFRVTFDGTDEHGMFKVKGSAEGVSLQLTDTDGHIILRDEPIEYKLISGKDIRLDYQLRLKSNSEELVAGDYQTTLKYRVEYF